MMFRGTKALPANGFMQTIARNGGEANAFTTADSTVFHERIGKDRLRLIMHLEADRMQNLILSDAAVAAERDVILAERRQRIDNDPEALVREQAEAALHLSHPYGRPVIGWAEEIRHIGRLEAENFYRRHFAPNNAILVVAGDVSPEEVRSIAEAEYGQLPPRELVARTEFAQPPRIGETRLAIAHLGEKVPELLRLYRVQSYADAAPGQAEALEILARMLGGDGSSLLNRRLVIERRLATEVSVSYDGYARDSGEIAISAVPRPGVSLETLERAIDEILASCARRAPVKADLARTKKLLVAGAIFRSDNPFEVASALGQALAIGLTVYDVQQWPARIQAVDGEAVRKAAASLAPKESVTAYLTNR
jgi:zinc protease